MLLGDVALDLGHLRGDEGPESVFHRPAIVGIPCFDEPGDLLERAPELLGTGDEAEPLDRAVVVDAVADAGPLGRCQNAVPERQRFRSSEGWWARSWSAGSPRRFGSVVPAPRS